MTTTIPARVFADMSGRVLTIVQADPPVQVLEHIRIWTDGGRVLMEATDTWRMLRTRTPVLDDCEAFDVLVHRDHLRAAATMVPDKQPVPDGDFEDMFIGWLDPAEHRTVSLVDNEGQLSVTLGDLTLSMPTVSPGNWPDLEEMWARTRPCASGPVAWSGPLSSQLLALAGDGQEPAVIHPSNQAKAPSLITIGDHTIAALMGIVFQQGPPSPSSLWPGLIEEARS